MATNDGGPAFPLAYEHEELNGVVRFVEWSGMTLRDYFAAKAMQTLSGNTDFKMFIREQRKDVNASIANIAYQYADAMIAARSPSPSPTNR